MRQNGQSELLRLIFPNEAFHIARVTKLLELVSCFIFTFWLINIFYRGIYTKKNAEEKFTPFYNQQFYLQPKKTDPI